MKRKVKNERDKAFIGAIVGAVGSIASGVASAVKKKKALRKQQIAQNKQDTLQGAQSITEAYSNQDYVDDFQDRIEFKNGGSMKTKNYKDRIKNEKKFRCGGRKKAKNGIKWTDNDTSDVISSVGSSIGSAISNSVDTTVKQGNPISLGREDIRVPDYVKNSVTNNQFATYRQGGVRKRACVGGKSRKK